jgi:hypothetical protein
MRYHVAQMGVAVVRYSLGRISNVGFKRSDCLLSTVKWVDYDLSLLVDEKCRRGLSRAVPRKDIVTFMRAVQDHEKSLVSGLKMYRSEREFVEARGARTMMILGTCRQTEYSQAENADSTSTSILILTGLVAPNVEQAFSPLNISGGHDIAWDVRHYLVGEKSSESVHLREVSCMRMCY